MKKILAAAAVLFVVPALALADAPLRRGITVGGDAEIKVVPDQVILTIAVETLDKDLLLAKKQNDERVKKVLAVATQFKVEPKHVQTEQIAIDPRYRTYSDKTTFEGYAVKKTIVICLKDLSRFEDVLTELLKAGTNSVPGIEFQSTELRKHRDQARLMATKAAREKAVAIAGELGAKVGKAVTIHENSYNSYGSRGGYSNMMAQNASSEGGGEADTSSTGFAPGQISIRASVTIDFDLD